MATSARNRYLQILISRVTADDYPSATQMQHIESMLTRDQIEAYVGVLIDKIQSDRFPSVPMMRRVEALLQRLR